MKTLAAAAVLFSSVAYAQQISQVNTCTSLLDGGTFETCGSFVTNYQPFAGVCQVAVPAGSAAATTINVLASTDGVHFGTIADGGLVFPVLVNDGGANAIGPAFSISPTNPYQSIEITASATAIDGGTGALNCYVGVIQAQTIHNKAKAAPAK